jgi:hypothetical protein
MAASERKAEMRGKLSYANVTATLALFAALGGVGIASIPGPDGKVHGCYANDRGSMRVVDSEEACAAAESRITFNQTGPRGAPGPPGPQGTSGAALSGESLTRLRNADVQQAALMTDVAAAFDGLGKSLQGVYDQLKRERKPKGDGLNGKIRALGKRIARVKSQIRKLKVAATKIKQLVACPTCR